MYKELLFEVSGGTPGTEYARYAFEHPGITARSQTLHSTDSSIWELVDARGPAQDLDGLRSLLQAGPAHPAEGLEILHDGRERIQFIVQWPRPKAGVGPASVEHLAYDHIGPEAILYTLIAGGRAEFKVAGPDGERLQQFYAAVQKTLEGRFTVKLLRIGEMRPDWEATPKLKRAPIRNEDRELITYALGAGYYDNPKRVGVRELGEALGWSKSVVARRLRQVERRALESLLTTQDPLPTPGREADVRAHPMPQAPDMGPFPGPLGEV